MCDLRNWWRQTGSNRRPPACKAGALPAELCPQNQSDAALQNTLHTNVCGGLLCLASARFPSDAGYKTPCIPMYAAAFCALPQPDFFLPGVGGKRLVGLEGLEPSTPALSRRCSNHLSYRPDLDLRSQQPISVNTQLPVHALERR